MATNMVKAGRDLALAAVLLFFAWTLWGWIGDRKSPEEQMAIEIMRKSALAIDAGGGVKTLGEWLDRYRRNYSVPPLRYRETWNTAVEADGTVIVDLRVDAWHGPRDTDDPLSQRWVCGVDVKTAQIQIVHVAGGSNCGWLRVAEGAVSP